MKKFTAVLALIFVAATLFTLAACGDRYEPYRGYQFSGTNPWGQELAITVRSVKDGKMDWTYTDTAGDLILYQELEGTPLNDMTAEFRVEGDAAVNVKFSYTGTITMKDGNLTVIYTGGALETVSSEGGSMARMVDAVPEAERTVSKVILDK